MQIDKNTLPPCPFCRCIPDGYEGRQVSCRCGAMGPIETQGDPEGPTWNTRAPIDKDTLRAALEGAVRPLEWSQLSDKTLATFCPLSGHRLTATSESGQTQQQNATTARILAAIDIDTLAAKLGGV